MLKKFIVIMMTCMTVCCYANSGEIQQTLSIIKPDAVRAGNIGGIINRLESEKLRVAGMKMIQLTQPQAKRFYVEHEGKPFFNDLAQFMTSGPIVVMVLEGPDAIARNRLIMGTTNPREAQFGTIRKMYAKSMTENAVHGSDSPESAKREIAFFFKPQEIVNGNR